MDFHGIVFVGFAVFSFQQFKDITIQHSNKQNKTKAAKLPKESIQANPNKTNQSIPENYFVIIFAKSTFHIQQYNDTFIYGNWQVPPQFQVNFNSISIPIEAD